MPAIKLFRPEDTSVRDAPPTVRSVIEWFVGRPITSASVVAAKERARLLANFQARYGHLAIDDCRAADLLAFIDSYPGVKSDWTRRRIRGTICRPFNLAASLGMIVRNPFAGVAIREGPQGRDWTAAEYRAILRASKPHFRRLIVFVRVSGARPGEARKLQWEHVREEVEAIVEREHKTAHITHEARRIYFNRIIIKLLDWLRRHKAHHQFVFVNAEGKPWTIGALTHRMRDVRRRAKLDRSVKVGGGRHTFATNAIVNGVDLATLAQLMGHRNVSTTSKYTHLVDKRPHLNAAMEKAVGGNL